MSLGGDSVWLRDKGQTAALSFLNKTHHGADMWQKTPVNQWEASCRRGTLAAG